MDKKIVFWPCLSSLSYFISKALRYFESGIRSRGIKARCVNGLVGCWMVEAYEVDGVRSVENKKLFTVGEGVDIVLSIRSDYVYSFDFVSRNCTGDITLYQGGNSGLADWVSSIDLVSSIGHSGYWTFFRKRSQLYFSGDFHNSGLKYVLFPLKSKINELREGRFKLLFMKRGRMHAILFKSAF